jgi:hypothetical protein
VPICDGQQHTFTVRVVPSQGSYTAGAARALTFAVVEHDGTAISGVDGSPAQIVS